MNPKAALELAHENECQFVDVKFPDLLGIWQHLSVPIQGFTEAAFSEGFAFDGSILRGWQPVHRSDLLAVPDPTTAKIDPFPKARTLSLIADIQDPDTRVSYSRDPRHVARKAEKYLRASAIAEAAHFGPEIEFFIFDDVRFDQTRNSAFYYVDSDEGRWNTGRDEGPNLGYKPRYKEGHFPTPPTDSLVDLRQEMVAELIKLGIPVGLEHHEAATGGQAGIDLNRAPLAEQGDRLQWFKYVLKNVARRNGKTVTFMAKPLFEDNGSGLRCHQSLWKGGTNLFAGDRYGNLSETALWYIGGLLKHAPALCAFTNPTTNSYRRLVSGFEGPTALIYSCRNRAAAVRVPACTSENAGRRVEFRLPDPSCNGYLAFSAMLMAGLDGIKNRIDPGAPFEADPSSLSAEEFLKIPSAPASLEEALSALQNDCEFLFQGEVFTSDLVEEWIALKYEEEIDPMRLRPTPWEFALYFDC
jgi:glutamine synthetase